MHTRKMTLLTRAGVLAVVLSATPSGYAWADGTNPPPVVVTPGNGHNILIGVNSPGGGAPVGSGGGGASAGNGSGGGAPAGGQWRHDCAGGVHRRLPGRLQRG